MISKEESLEKIKSFYSKYYESLDASHLVYEQWKAVGDLELECSRHFNDHLKCIDDGDCTLINNENTLYLQYESGMQKLLDLLETQMEMCKSILLSNASHYLDDDQIKYISDIRMVLHHRLAEFNQKKTYLKAFILKS